MIKAKVISATTINNVPVKVGAIVEVDENTFRNLQAKGRLELAGEQDENSDGLDALTVKDLHEKAGALNIAHSALNKQDLIDAIRAATVASPQA